MVTSGADAVGPVLDAYPTGVPAYSHESTGRPKRLTEQPRLTLRLCSSSAYQKGIPPGKIPLEDGLYSWGDTLTTQKAAIHLGLTLKETSDQDNFRSTFLSCSWHSVLAIGG